MLREKRIQVLCSLLVAIMCLTSAFTTSANVMPQNASRLFGSDRYETAVQISKAGWTSSQYVVLARGDDFPDALCAGPLAKKYNAPILLTATDMLNEAVLNEIQRLNASSIIIIGGKGAVSENVENTLISRGMKVERIFGSDRYETSAKVAERLSTSNEIALATGNDFPDALSISAIAANIDMPILLTEKHSIPDKVKQYISNHNINKTYVIGGQGVISDSALDAVPGGERLSGSDRFETNAVVMEKFSNELKFDNVYLAVADGPNGDEFADALSGSVLAAKTQSPLVLVHKELSPIVENFIKPKMNQGSKAIALGGESVVPTFILEDILKLDETSVYIKLINSPSAIRIGENKTFTVEVTPRDAVISASSSNPSAVSVSVSGSNVTVTGVGRGIAAITVAAKADGYNSGVASFTVSPAVYNVTKDIYYDTIQSAIDGSSSGDTIKIAPGMYSEHLVVNKNNLKLIGADKDRVIIDASQEGKVTRAGIKLQNVSGVEIKNLTVRNAGMNLTNEFTREPYGIYVKNSDKNVFSNLKLTGNGEYEIYLYDGCDLNTVQDSTIDGSKLASDYKSLDGIFCSGGESGRSSMNTGNKFTNNTIRNVVYGISLTASQGTEVLDNSIEASDCTSWNGYVSAGVVLSNSSYNIVDKNTITLSQYGVRISTLSSLSPYSYAGTPDSNKVSMNSIAPAEYGVRVMGFGNIVENNNIIGKDKTKGIWLAESAKVTNVTGNIIANCEPGVLVDNAANEAHFNKFINNTLGVKNNTSDMFKASNNYWGEQKPDSLVSANVEYSPWLGKGDDANLEIPGFQVPSNMIWCANDSLQKAVDQAGNGDTIQLSKSTYTLDRQLYINKDITIVGAGKVDTAIKIAFDTTSEDAGRGAMLVGTGKRLNISNLTIDGSDKKVFDAIRTSGYGVVENVEIKNIDYSGIDGNGISAFGNADVIVKGSSFTNIRRAGIGVFDNAHLIIGGGSETDSNTFAGSGDPNYPQYAVFINSTVGNPKAHIIGNKISSYNSLSTQASLSSAGICVLAGNVEINNNAFDNCPDGIKIWTESMINNTEVDSASAVPVGKDLESRNTYTGNIAHRVVIYDRANSSVVYPVPVLNSIRQ